MFLVARAQAVSVVEFLWSRDERYGSQQVKLLHGTRQATTDSRAISLNGELSVLGHVERQVVPRSFWAVLVSAYFISNLFSRVLLVEVKLDDSA